MKIQLLRHATCVVEIGGRRILVDPVFSPKGTRPPIINSPRPQNNPLVDLPLGALELSELLKGIDGFFVSHTHSDHLDPLAIEMLPKDKPVFCQPSDREKLIREGFTGVREIKDLIQWAGMTIIRTGGKHGCGVIGKAMGDVSGFVLEAPGEPVLYIAGDTVWCSAVEETLRKYQPQVAVAYAGAAQFNTGKPITMDKEDVAVVCRSLPDGKVVAVHMEAYNHCLLKRDELKAFLETQGLAGQVVIPLEGQWMDFH